MKSADLPLLGQPSTPGTAPAERADAARNRAKILEAAAGLFAERDPRGVTMDDIAKAAGVGRGTLYRRYPDVVSIAVALLDEYERTVQEQLLSGPPPLGPGAPPAERLAAFYAAMIDLLDAHANLVLGAETGSARFATGAYQFWRVHVRTLATEAGVPEPDSLVEPLLAPLAAEVYLHQKERGLTSEEIKTALGRLAHGVLS
ncbi:TetR/AcrR family transcriptional regulator [Nocardia huaxiensis]|uniref:TetR/AcrR family transcriptional regulator n=1 Tax=Nocardia huaxiensis TaxID=2755382 RepID=A0A7D6VBE6_9NOCA|nr:TetR/AcrR family transcriptional regulator [Nocardia huaxiensis]QLY31434.1 TetR/AcrR family transcriptional regulator [Nocardia huaxiensis]